MKFKCLAIDDEPYALKLLVNFIENHADLELIFSTSSSINAQNFLNENKIDCIFLDIEMPELNGVEFAKSIQTKNAKTSIVFVSAYSEYAIEGFKVSAVDFLLKPYSFEDFERAVEKVKLHQKLNELEKNEDSFFLKVDSKQVKITFSTILYVESMKDYLKIYTTERDIPFIPLKTLKNMRELLPEYFIQINRSQIVNFNEVDSYGKNSLIINKKIFSISNKFRADFERFIQ